jgi:hypothetical protein
MVAASLDSGGDDVGGGGSLLCLLDENSSRPWMAHNSVIEIVKSEAVKMVSTKEKEGESSPVLVVAASLGSVGEGVGSGGSLLCLWTENSSRL